MNTCFKSSGNVVRRYFLLITNKIGGFNMDNINKIALSRIADIVTRGNLIIPELDGFKRIFYNSGLSEYYEEHRHKLKEMKKEENWEVCYYMNDRSYSGLLDIFYVITDDSTLFIKLVNSILERISIYRIFNDEIDKIISRNSYSQYVDVKEYLSKKGSTKANEFLKDFASKDFKELRTNFNLLALDISFTDELNLSISSLTLREEDETAYKSGMLNWLEKNYTNVFSSYENAVKMCSQGNRAECLSDCRNVLTGIFTYHKEERTKWYTGLKLACKDDKNINNVSSSNNILLWKNGDANNVNPNKRYNYPRFKTISQIYSFLSDLGPHKDEANIVDGIVDFENPTLEDAFWGLRLTESILIWLYQNQSNDL